MSSLISLPEPFDRASLPSPMLNRSNTCLDDAHQRFCKNMDQLADVNVYSIWNECYPIIETKKFHGAYRRSRCILERKGNHFSLENNMDLGNQPTVLAVLTRVEEMLISCANPILQLTHAHGGQYK